MVMVLPEKEAVTPAGSPVAVPIPVAPVVVWVMEVERAVLMQTVAESGDCALAVLVGLTVIVNVSGVPGHSLAVGVTVTVPVMATVPALVAVNDAIFPVPLPPKPIAVLLLPHVNVVPLTDEVKLIAPLASPAQKVLLATASTVGAGLTFTST